MIILHEHHIPTGHWVCAHCTSHNDPEAERCWSCDRDMDGELALEVILDRRWQAEVDATYDEQDSEVYYDQDQAENELDLEP